jgi:riboflavin synthase alpha subunit
LRPQDRVNLEVDLVARYLARYMDMRGESQDPDPGP